MEKYCPKCFKKYPLTVEVCPADGSFLVSPHEKDLTGQVLDDRYTVLERIGRGGMGVVYKAEQHLVKRMVALKVLRREMVQDETAVKRFMVEAQAIAALGSRFTVTLHDFGVTREGLLYYTMELLKGQPLAKLIAKEAPLGYRRAARLAMQVCESLDEAHERGILHRDIKPDNVFVVPDRRGKEDVKVLDFGIAKLMGDTSAESMTRTGMIVGTPQYLSPEQAMGNPVVPASDLYSLGIMLYEMLAGLPPFLADTPMKTLWAHVKEPVPSLQSKNPAVEVPASIERFLAKALDKDPGRRFPCAAAFRDALRHAVEDHDARPETVALSPLSTTDEGMRVRTDEIRPALPAPSEVEGSGVEGNEEPAQVRSERPASLRATKPQKPPAGAGDMTVGYADEGEEVTPDAEARSPERPSVPVGETQTGEDVLSEPKVSSVGPGIGAGSEGATAPMTPTLFGLRSRRRKLLLAALAGLAVLMAVVVVWRPWEPPLREEDTVPTVQGELPEEGTRSADSGVGNAELKGPRSTAEGGGAAAGDAAAKKPKEQINGKPVEDVAAARAAENARRETEEEAAQKKAEEAARQTAELETTKKANEEAARKAAEEEAARKKAEETARNKAELEAKKRVDEEAASRAIEEKAARKKAEEEAKKAEEETAARKAAEQAAAKKAAEEDAKRATQAEAERKRKDEEEARRRKVGELVRKGDLAMQENRWKDCVGYLEEVLRLGGSTSSVQAKLEKCRDMATF